MRVYSYSQRRKRGTVSHEDNAAESDAQAPDGALDRYGNPADHPSFNQFVATISALRAPDGCPWDREQTHVSISHNMIEEAYEAVCAIEEEDVAHLREELGDVLLQVVLQSQIAADAGEFTIDDVCSDVNAKMVRRHPHVFGSVEASNASEVLDVWDQVKLAERQATGGADGSGASEPEGLLDGVPRTFPALMEAQKLSRKAAAVGCGTRSPRRKPSSSRRTLLLRMLQTARSTPPWRVSSALTKRRRLIVPRRRKWSSAMCFSLWSMWAGAWGSMPKAPFALRTRSSAPAGQRWRK